MQRDSDDGHVWLVYVVGRREGGAAGDCCGSVTLQGLQGRRGVNYKPKNIMNNLFSVAGGVSTENQ